MIFQVKMTLEEMPEPVWRRLEIESEMTFSQLHDVIQIAFEWENRHRYHFESIRRNGRKCVNTYIQNKDFELLDGAFDEEKEILANWLIKPKDKMIYTYDFGDNWEHTIELEKIVEKKDHRNYPHCVKAMRVAPDEDSRLDILSDAYDFEHVPSNVLTEEVNRYLKEIVADDDGSDYLRMELLEVAKQFNRKKPWLRIGIGQLFMIHDEEFDEPFYCTLLGDIGDVFGMMAFIGDEGKQSFQRYVIEDMSDIDLAETPCYLITFNDREELEAESYEFIKQVDYSFRGKKQWPAFYVFEPGKNPSLPNDEQIEAMISIMKQTLELMAYLKKEQMDIPPYSSGVPIICREGFLDDWETTFYPSDLENDQLSIPPLLVSEIEVKRIKKLPKHHQAIEIGLIRIEDHEDGPAMMILLAHAKIGVVLHQKIIQVMDIEEFQRGLLLCFVEVNFCPTMAKVHVNEQPLFWETLHAIDCAIEAEQTLPNVENFVRRLQNDLFNE